MIGLIKTEKQYKEATKRLRLLMLSESRSSDEEQELELLAAYIDDFDANIEIEEALDPIDAINIRMVQLEISRKDLEQYIGNKSAVAAVLNRKKPMSLSVIRRLSVGLNLPLGLLAKEYALSEELKIEFTDALLKFLTTQAKDWFKNLPSDWKVLKNNTQEHLEPKVKMAISALGKQGALLRTSLHDPAQRTNKKMDMAALLLWQARVLDLAAQSPIQQDFDKVRFQERELTQIAQLSRHKNGPGLVKEELARYGIHFVVCTHAPKTYLDGAVLKGRDGKPVVALTLRYDRLDNFFHVLLHELSHIVRHYGENSELFVDDLDFESDEKIEKEADLLALDSVIPAEEWERCYKYLSSQDALKSIADDFNIDAALLAGRYRRQSGNYQKHSRLIGNKQVRRIFWENN